MKDAKDVTRGIQSAEELRSFKNQAQVRLFICAFMGMYYLQFGFSTHPLYLCFAAYSFFTFWYSKQLRRLPPLQITICITLDNAFSILGLFATGKTGTFLLFFLIHISFGYGIRFGFRYLIISLMLACTGITWLCVRSVVWRGDIHFFISFLLGMPFISLYIYYLTHRVRASELAVRQHEKALRELTSFVLHDLRTPLSAMLSSLNILLEEAKSFDDSQRLRRLVRTVSSLGDLLSNSISYHLSLTNEPLNVPVAKSLARWIIEKVEAFRDVVEEQGGTLKITLHSSAAHICGKSYSEIERVVLNALSNASRFCRQGSIDVDLLPPSADSLRQVIRITNRWAHSDTTSSVLGGGSLSSNDQLFGTGLGVLSANSVIEAVGGSYNSTRTGEYEWTTVFDFPCERLPPKSSNENRPPVILVFSDDVNSLQVRPSDIDEREIYVWSSMESIDEYSKEVEEVPWILFIARSWQGYAQRMVGNRSKYALVVGVEDANREPSISITGRELTLLADGASQSLQTWTRLCEEIHDSVYPKAIRTSALLQGATVLIVEDEDLTRHMLIKHFRDLGAKVHSAASFAHGLEMAQKHNVTVLVSDWFLGNENLGAYLEDFLGIEECALQGVLVVSGYPTVTLPSSDSSIPILFVPKPLTRESLELLIERTRGRIFGIDKGSSKTSSLRLLDAVMVKEIIESAGPASSGRMVLHRFLEEIETTLFEVFDGTREASSRERTRHKLVGAAQLIGADAFISCLRETEMEIAATESALDRRGYASALESWNYTKAHLLALAHSIQD